MTSFILKHLQNTKNKYATFDLELGPAYYLLFPISPSMWNSMRESYFTSTMDGYPQMLQQFLLYITK